mmetsp:Transcript_6393/g.18425  ORF Transcript_6393/g.18425 Transcript_6393/m.18425 type:complete len:132 (-) Transcript_6393:649-1044(-)
MDTKGIVPVDLWAILLARCTSNGANAEEECFVRRVIGYIAFRVWFLISPSMNGPSITHAQSPGSADPRTRHTTHTHANHRNHHSHQAAPRPLLGLCGFMRCTWQSLAAMAARHESHTFMKPLCLFLWDICS